MLSHAATEMEVNILPARGADLRRSRQICREIHFAAMRRGLKLYPQPVVTALSVQRSPTLPIGEDVEFPAQVESPGVEKTRQCDHENSAKEEHES